MPTSTEYIQGVKAKAELLRLAMEGVHNMAKKKRKFQKGDIVRLRNGKKPLKVVRVYDGSDGYYGYRDHRYDLRYLHNNSHRHYEMENNMVLFEGDANDLDGVIDMNKLYEITIGQFGAKKYGHKLAVNSQGKWVMEIKGTGETLPVDKSQCEEVLPYSIAVQYGGNNTEYHYQADKGKFEKGAFYLVAGDNGNGWSIARVTKVDTKDRRATKKFKVFGRLMVTPIEEDKEDLTDVVE